MFDGNPRHDGIRWGAIRAAGGETGSALDT
jgi:hypothetical protein